MTVLIAWVFNEGSSSSGLTTTVVNANMRLGDSEWKTLYKAIADLHSDIRPGKLKDRAIATANLAISGEITAFDFFTAGRSMTPETLMECLVNSPVG